MERLAKLSSLVDVVVLVLAEVSVASLVAANASVVVVSTDLVSAIAFWLPKTETPPSIAPVIKVASIRVRPFFWCSSSFSTKLTSTSLVDFNVLGRETDQSNLGHQRLNPLLTCLIKLDVGCPVVFFVALTKLIPSHRP